MSTDIQVLVPAGPITGGNLQEMMKAAGWALQLIGDDISDPLADETDDVLPPDSTFRRASAFAAEITSDIASVLLSGESVLLSGDKYQNHPDLIGHCDIDCSIRTDYDDGSREELYEGELKEYREEFDERVEEAGLRTERPIARYNVSFTGSGSDLGLALFDVLMSLPGAKEVEL